MRRKVAIKKRRARSLDVGRVSVNVVSRLYFATVKMRNVMMTMAKVQAIVTRVGEKMVRIKGPYSHLQSKATSYLFSGKNIMMV